MEMILWNFYHEDNTKDWNYSYTRTYIWFINSDIHGDIA
jgi:hypothetical protein